ncbi:uncharacterized protein LOC136035448 isoform X2 [Artemia franciscana]|nr:hypothetical protein QYM36_003899 [Artemia franciscana]KAK2721736.1 hypothetical protein QYM36_003899 [Artemia franciscana]
MSSVRAPRIDGQQNLSNTFGDDPVVENINLGAIKLQDPYAKDIVATATMVAVYKFDVSSNNWGKPEVQGSFFVYSRLAEPKHCMFILNRLEPKNWAEPIVKDLELKLEAPFILTRTKRAEVYGLWFYEQLECRNTFYKLDSLIKDQSKSEEEDIADKFRLSIKSEPKDVLSLLIKAKEEKTKGVKSQASTPISSTRPIPIINSSNNGSLSVDDLFGRSLDRKEIIKDVGKEERGEKIEERCQINLLQRLLSSSSDFESQFRQETKSVDALEKDLKQVLKIGNSPRGSINNLKNLELIEPAPVSIPGIFPLEKCGQPPLVDFQGTPLFSPGEFRPNVTRTPPHSPLEREVTDLCDLLTPQAMTSNTKDSALLSPAARVGFGIRSVPVDPVQPEKTEFGQSEAQKLTKQQLSDCLLHLIKVPSIRLVLVNPSVHINVFRQILTCNGSVLHL